MEGTRVSTILVVDDDDDYRQLMLLALEKEGYQTCEAINGIQALQVAREIKPALILMDLSMPILDGKQAAEQIRQEPSLHGVPILFISGFGNLGMDLYLSMDTLGYGPVEYLAKPLGNFPDLMKLIKDLLKKGAAGGTPSVVGR